jgi:hypothetical protein
MNEIYNEEQKTLILTHNFHDNSREFVLANLIVSVLLIVGIIGGLLKDDPHQTNVFLAAFVIKLTAMYFINFFWEKHKATTTTLRLLNLVKNNQSTVIKNIIIESNITEHTTNKDIIETVNRINSQLCSEANELRTNKDRNLIQSLNH